jgi:hypothetical protein
MGLSLLLGCLLFVASPHCEAQNLVPNPSFEEIDSCPPWPFYLGFQESSTPLHWARRSETPDYFNACNGSSDTVPGVPRNLFSYQFAQDGNAYAGMFAHLIDDYREMIGTELLEPLTVGQTYYGSFWVNAAYGGPQQTGSACNNIGMLLMTSAFSEVITPNDPQLPLPNHAQIFSQQVVSDTANWTLVSGSFVADSAYRYLVIGNQFDNLHTTLQILGPGNPDKAYVFVDAVCLSASPDGCPLWNSIVEHTSQQVVMGPIPTSDELRVGWGSLPVHRVVVLDALGQMIVAHDVDGKSAVIMSTGGWPNGVYHLLLEAKGGKQARKFVVMH